MRKRFYFAYNKASVRFMPPGIYTQECDTTTLGWVSGTTDVSFVMGVDPVKEYLSGSVIIQAYSGLTATFGTLCENIPVSNITNT